MDLELRNSKGQLAQASLTITLNHPQSEFLLLVLANLSSTGLEIFVPKGGMPEDKTRVPMSGRMRLPSSHKPLSLCH